jgi:ADP-ribosylglycohydrolase
MLGAIIGDLVGSRFEFNNHRSKTFELLTKDCFVTDDSILTLAVAQAIMETEKDTDPLSDGYESGSRYLELLGANTVTSLRDLGRRYPACGYGGRFAQWLFGDNPQPYNSYGNGAAMRISPAGFAARTESEAVALSRTITTVTHNHDQGIKGAEATTVALFMARQGYLKREIRDRITRDYYPIDFTIDAIRPTYVFDETCQETVPQALACFFESESFEDAIRTAISLGGDSDTIAAIAGAIAEAYYGIPDDLREQALTYLDARQTSIVRDWAVFTGEDHEPFRVLTKYIGLLSPVSTEADRTSDQENDAPEQPAPLPRTQPDRVGAFIEEFNQFADSHPRYQLAAYEEILARYGLKGDQQDMREADFSHLDAQGVLALIMGAVRAARRTDGAIPDLLADGRVLQGLKRLKAIDCPVLDKKIAELRLSIGGFGVYKAYHLLFVDNRAYLLTGMSLGLPQLQKSYTLRETEQLREAWQTLHIEHWQMSYPQQGELRICDGTQWSLFVRYAGSRGKIYSGDNTYPETWAVLLELLSLADDGADDGEPDGEPGRQPGDFIYCRVSFSDYGKTYYYQTKDEEIKVGDFVYVPVGPDNSERVAVVQTVEYYAPTALPFPLAETKHITGRIKNKEAHIATLQLDNLVLCNEQNAFVKVKVWAEVKEGCLRISGLDLRIEAGCVAEDDEYAYLYDFDSANTKRLFALLSPRPQDLRQMFKRKFSGLTGCQKLSAFCRENGIVYQFFSC